jgi:hypothetical protein
MVPQLDGAPEDCVGEAQELQLFVGPQVRAVGGRGKNCTADGGCGGSSDGHLALVVVAAAAAAAAVASIVAAITMLMMMTLIIIISSIIMVAG